ncbi:hypothetical protein HDC31_003805, partial [Microbacterium sp. JAI119]|nr:hypothetical protein [Microbacterium sp. JAI119]
TSIEEGPPHAAERPRVGNFDEQNRGISVSAVTVSPIVVEVSYEDWSETESLTLD